MEQITTEIRKSDAANEPARAASGGAHTAPHSVQISSLELRWRCCGMTAADAPVQEVIKVTHRPSTIQWSQYNGLGELIQQRFYPLSRQERDAFFQLLHEIFGPWEGFDRRNPSDYSLEICDGSQWELLLRYAHNPVRHIIGAVALPPYGKRITEELRKLLAAHGCEASPAFFGTE